MLGCMALRRYATRRGREEHELDLLRGWDAGVALGGVDGIDTGADDGTTAGES